MWRPRIPLAPLLLALAMALVAGGCDLAGRSTPAPSLDPSASPVIQTEATFCGALDVLESEHQVLREIKLRQTNRSELADQFDEVQIAWEELQRVAPRGMRDQLDAMRWAVIDLGLAIEDYTTSARLDQAADHVLKRDLAFDKAIGRMRARTTCAPWAPTPRPVHTPPPSPTTAPTRPPVTDRTPVTSPGDAPTPSGPAASVTPAPIAR